MVLYPTPGLKVFATLDSPNRGKFPVGNRTFAVGGASFYEILGNGTAIKYGTVVNDGKQVTFAANQASPPQLVLASGGVLYLFNLGTLAFSQPAGLLASVVQVGFCDGYFLALLSDGRMQISGLLDGSSWPGLQFIAVSVIPDQPIGMLVDHREVWLWSGTRGVAYFNSGSSNIFDPIGSSAVLEVGNRAPASSMRADNTVWWIDASERGGGMARKLQGYTPVRISNHAVEYQWSLYPTLADAIGFAYEDQGHTFLQWYFPSANGGLGATWVYDIATGLWHERAAWDAINGVYTAHLSRSHAYTFGKHLVGDPFSGNIYDMSIGYSDDVGNVIRRMRIGPPISYENEWLFISQFQLDMEAGIALQVGQGTNPIVNLSWSDDGHTWSNEYPGAAGLVGQYKQRVIWRRLGRSRQRTFKVVATDPIPWRLIEADLIAPPYFMPQERLPKQYQKVS